MIPDLVEIHAYKIACWIKKREQVNDLESLYEYIAYKLNEIYIVSLSLIIGLFTGRVIESIYAIIGLYVVKKLTGGYHFESLTKCVIVSVVLISVSTLINLNSLTNVILSTVSVILILLYGSNIYNIEKKLKILFKLLSIIVVLVAFVMQIDSVCIVCFVQCATLIIKRG